MIWSVSLSWLNVNVNLYSVATHGTGGNEAIRVGMRCEECSFATEAVLVIPASEARGGVTVFGYIRVCSCGFVGRFFLYRMNRYIIINNFYVCWVPSSLVCEGKWSISIKGVFFILLSRNQITQYISYSVLCRSIGFPTGTFLGQAMLCTKILLWHRYLMVLQFCVCLCSPTSDFGAGAEGLQLCFTFLTVNTPSMISSSKIGLQLSSASNSGVQPYLEISTPGSVVAKLHCSWTQLHIMTAVWPPPQDQ